MSNEVIVGACVRTCMNGFRMCAFSLHGRLTSVPLLHWFPKVLLSSLSLTQTDFQRIINQARTAQKKKNKKKSQVEENDDIYAAHDTRLKIHRVSKCICCHHGIHVVFDKLKLY